MLEVRCEFTIPGDDCPAVGEGLDLVRTLSNHRFDRQAQPGPQQDPLAGVAIVGHLGLFVHLLPDAMTDQRANDTVAVRLGVRLYRMTDIGEVVAFLHLRDPQHQRFLRDAHEPGRGFTDAADAYRGRRIRNVALEGRADIDRQDVALTQSVLTRDAVNHHLIHRSADRRRKPVVTFEGRNAALRANRLLGKPIQFAQGHPRARGPQQHRERARRDLPALAHDLHRVPTSSRSRPGCLAPECTENRLGDGVDRLEPVDADELSLLFVIADQRRGLLIVGRQPLGNDVDGIVAALYERTAVFVVDPRETGRVKFVVVRSTRSRIGPASGQAPHERLAVRFDRKHRGKRQPQALQHTVERLGLCNGAWKAIENEGWLAAQLTFHHRHDQVVGHEIARIHERLRLPPELRLGRDLSA